MNEARETLRTETYEKLLSVFPNAQKVTGGIAWISDTLDEETGKYFPVEVNVTIKNTADTKVGHAYDLDAEVAKYNANAERRSQRAVADPEAAQKKAAAAAIREVHRKTLMDFVESHSIEGMTATEIKEAVPAFAEITPLYLGGLLRELVEEGVLTVAFSTDGKRKKLYSK